VNLQVLSRLVAQSRSGRCARDRASTATPPAGQPARTSRRGRHMTLHQKDPRIDHAHVQPPRMRAYVRVATGLPPGGYTGRSPLPVARVGACVAVAPAAIRLVARSVAGCMGRQAGMHERVASSPRRFVGACWMQLTPAAAAKWSACMRTALDTRRGGRRVPEERRARRATNHHQPCGVGDQTLPACVRTWPPLA
jgi:hypothetical protein